MKRLIADGLFVKVDDADYDNLVRYEWHVEWRTKDHPYVYRYERRIHGDSTCVSLYKRVRLHRQILDYPALSVDHRNGDTLDNQRSNLRLATQQQQAHNTRRRNGKRFKGVTYCPTIHGKYRCNVPWRARIRINGKLTSLGFYATELDAARAYNKAARKHFGAFACLNKIPRSQ